MAVSPTVTLNDGRTMPTLGLGTYSITGDGAPEVFLQAIESGYRLLDTASRYENEAEVGRAVAETSVPRDELFVTTKLRGSDHGATEPRRALEESLGRLGLDHVDLYLIHWPLPRVGRYLETWEALLELREDGLARSVGVSNFLPEHLDHVVGATGVAPAVNQVELHPLFPQARQRAADAGHGTATQSWSPLARGTDLLERPQVTGIAEKHRRDPGQVVLRWHLEQGALPIPKSSTPERLASNLQVYDFALDEEDLAALSTLDTARRTGGDPAEHEEF